MQVSDPYLRERLFDLEDLANRLQQHLVRTAAERGLGRIAARIHPRRPRDGTGRAVGLRAPADHGSGARGRLADRPCRDRRARLRHPGRRAGRRCDEPDRGGRHRRRRRRSRPGADPAERRHPAIGRRRGRGAQPAPRLLRDACARPRRSPATGSRSSCCSTPGCCSTCAQLATTGAEGVGLFRTEFPLMVRDSFPGCRRADRILPARLRAGGAAPGRFPHARYRRRQGAALSAACRRGQPGDGLAGDPHRARPPGDAAAATARVDPRRRRRATLFVKFPMIAEVAELERARALVDMELRARGRGGTRALPRSIKIGVMLEVPSLLWQLPALCERIDFLSIGTNDLAAVSLCLRSRQSAPGRSLRSALGADAGAVPRGHRAHAALPGCRSACAARWPATRSRRWC